MEADGEDGEETCTASEGEYWTDADRPSAGYLVQQVYREKMDNLLWQLNEAREGRHPAYLHRINLLEREMQEQVLEIQGARERELKLAQREYEKDISAAEEEYEQAKAKLLEKLESTAENRRKQYKDEYTQMSLRCNSNSSKVRPKRGVTEEEYTGQPTKPVAELVWQLPMEDIEEDLKAISKAINPDPLNAKTINGFDAELGALGNSATPLPLTDESKIENNQLWTQGRWFQRGQAVYIVGQRMVPFTGTITMFSTDKIYVKHSVKDKTATVDLSSLHSNGMCILPRNE